MDYISPEKAGINPGNIEKYIWNLEKRRLATHNVIMAKGNSIFFERYWKPFDKDFLHRMYSVSKSFVSLAVGFLIQDGKITPQDTMEKHFSGELKNQPDINMHKQTVRDMLMMQTAKPSRYWFGYKPKDRVAFYFENDLEESVMPGTIFHYDSDGSFVLCALVERITGKPFMEYLREKLFDKIGVSEEAYCLKCPGGHSWGDSGVLCKPTDLLKVARFVLNRGSWNGEQLLNRDYLDEAVSAAVFNNYPDIENFETNGYGFQFWKAYEDGFLFNGMGCQFALCIPGKDLILIYNGDNQGKEAAIDCIIDDFFKLIEDEKANEEKQSSEKPYSGKGADYNLISANGARHSDFEKEINGVTYVLNKNPMGIKKFRLVFKEKGGTFEYTNSQGDKVISFGMCENVFGLFPQEGYSDLTGGVPTKDFYYKCAASAAWVEPYKLYIKIQIIDKYFGNMSVTIGFKEDGCGLYMEKNAEDFLNEYKGFACGKRM